MITNERQYRITKAEAAKFEQAIKAFDGEALRAEGQHVMLVQAQREGLESQYQSLVDELSEYEALKSGAVPVLRANSLAELPLLLIKARIANNLTQQALADSLGLKPQQIQRYESEKYVSASLARLIQVAAALNLDMKEEARILPREALSAKINPSEPDWLRFPIKEMFQRGWFEGFSGTLKDARNNAEQLVCDYFNRAGPSGMTLVHHRKKIRTGSKVNNYALSAWQAHVMMLACQTPLAHTYQSGIITTEWLHQLAKLSAADDGPKQAQKFLNENGIHLIVEPHLAETHLDGAAMRLTNGTPVVGLTARHDRLDNFWFVLFHELAHIALHMNDNDLDFFDDSDAAGEGIEVEADKFAQETLLPSGVWEKSIARFTRTAKAVQAESAKLCVNTAIIAGRIRQEADDYTLLNDLIGQRHVRRLFPEARFKPQQEKSS